MLPASKTARQGIALAPSAETPCDAASGVIRVRVRDRGQLFNSLDPAPFLERDLDDDLVDFISSWAREIPDDRPLQLQIHISDSPVAPAEQADVSKAVHGHFSNAATLKQNEYRQLVRTGRRHLTVGLIALGTATLLSSFVPHLVDEPLARILQESLIVGGWVAMWRPMELLLYDRLPVRREARLYERLAQAEVQVAGAS